MITAATPSVPAGLVTILRGEPIRWEDLGLTRDEFFALCDREELRGLLFSRIAAFDALDDWPVDIRDELAQNARDDTAREMLSREENAAVLGALAGGGVRAILLKGAALAYTVYDTPIARPRLDTDLLIDAADQDAARGILGRCGYQAPPYCDQLFSQFQMERTDEFGLRHVFDVHWKISTQPVFADVLTYEEMRHRAIQIPALGPRAVAAGPVDALLLACVHPVMHHRNAERILWMYDIHLLASRLSAAELLTFAKLASEKRVARICAQALRSAHGLFNTWVPDSVVRCLDAAGAEASAEYLVVNRRWHDELMSSLRSLPGMRHRLRLLREVLFPNPAYMFDAYRLNHNRLGPLLLPALYLHRNLHGAWKICSGRK